MTAQLKRIADAIEIKAFESMSFVARNRKLVALAIGLAVVVLLSVAGTAVAEDCVSENC